MEQFLVDIDNEFEPGAWPQSNYFIGSIIIVKNDKKHDVIDGQQRLTTIVLTMCALRDVMQRQTLNDTQANYLGAVSEWLSSFDVETGKVQLRLELQYEESKDFLALLIQGKEFAGEKSASIRKMQSAYDRIKAELESHRKKGADVLTGFAAYFLTKIDLVVIKSENLSSALKIFETINQRGAGLNAMDLIKNLLFSKAPPDEFTRIKEKWKELTAHLQAAREDDKPLRFLRYFLMARYHNGILREDDIYKWVISPEGKTALNFENQPYKLAVELERMAKRYADLVNATELQQDGGDYPDVTRIGFINKVRSRQHLILLLALDNNAPVSSLNYLAKQLESFFFFSNTLGIQAKENERLFVQWATRLRGLNDEVAISVAVQETILKELMGKVADFKERFLSIRHSAYDPGYRLRFVLGRMENTLISQAGLPQFGLKQIDAMQVEHILPQMPKNGVVPATYAANFDEYQNQVFRLGNVTLLESQINQAVNNFNDLNSDWFRQKQAEYGHTSLLTPKLLDDQFQIGNNTATNRLKSEYDFEFTQWGKAAIEKRQSILLDLAMETWKINDKRIDNVASAEVPAQG